MLFDQVQSKTRQGRWAMATKKQNEGQELTTKNKLGPFGEFFINTSYALWQNLLNEPDQQTRQAAITAEMIEKLEVAAVEKSIVVLLVEKAYDLNHYETITGWMATKELNPPLIPVKLPAEGAPIQMVPLARVRKLSILDKHGAKTSVTRG